jgi:hypothetical protein
MSRTISVRLVGVLLMVLGLMGAAWVLDVPASEEGGEAKIKAVVGQPLSAEEHKHVLAAIHLHLKVDPKKPHLHVIHARPASDDDKVEGAKGKHLVKAIAVDYRTNTGVRLTLDAKTLAVIAEEKLPGRPQSSADERARAAALIRADKELAKVLKEGAIAGGFIVPPPKEVAPGQRIMKLDIVSSDHSKFLRHVYVDLSAGKIASVTTVK